MVQALHRRRARLESAGIEPTRDNCAATHVVHVHPDGRRVFIGDEHDVTAHGGNIMAFNKAWKSAPIRSWVRERLGRGAVVLWAGRDLYGSAIAKEWSQHEAWNIDLL